MAIDIFADYPLNWRPSKENLKRLFYKSLFESSNKIIRSTVASITKQRSIDNLLNYGDPTVIM